MEPPVTVTVCHMSLSDKEDAPRLHFIMPRDASAPLSACLPQDCTSGCSAHLRLCPNRAQYELVLVVFGSHDK